MSMVSGRISQAVCLVVAAVFAAGPAAVLGAVSPVCTGESAGLANITAAAPECFAPDACPQACSPLEALLSLYEKEAIKASVCKDREDFGCFFKTKNMVHCSKVFMAVSNIQIELPRKKADLEALTCAATVVPATIAGCEELAKTPPNGITNVLGQELYGSRACYEKCPDICGLFIDMEVLEAEGKTAKLTRAANRDKVMAAMCENARTFRCLVEPANVVVCKMAIIGGEEAIGGFLMPKSIAELVSECEEEETSSTTKKPSDVAGSRGGRPAAWSVAAAAVVAGSVLPFAAATP